MSRQAPSQLPYLLAQEIRTQLDKALDPISKHSFKLPSSSEAEMEQALFVLDGRDISNLFLLLPASEKLLAWRLFQRLESYTKSLIITRWLEPLSIDDRSPKNLNDLKTIIDLLIVLLQPLPPDSKNINRENSSSPPPNLPKNLYLFLLSDERLFPCAIAIFFELDLSRRRKYLKNILRLNSERTSLVSPALKNYFLRILFIHQINPKNLDNFLVQILQDPKNNYQLAQDFLDWLLTESDASLENINDFFSRFKSSGRAIVDAFFKVQKNSILQDPHKIRLIQFFHARGCNWPAVLIPVLSENDNDTKQQNDGTDEEEIGHTEGINLLYALGTELSAHFIVCLLMAAVQQPSKENYLIAEAEYYLNNVSPDVRLLVLEKIKPTLILTSPEQKPTQSYLHILLKKFNSDFIAEFFSKNDPELAKNYFAILRPNAPIKADIFWNDHFKDELRIQILMEPERCKIDILDFLLSDLSRHRIVRITNILNSPTDSVEIEQCAKLSRVLVNSLLQNNNLKEATLLFKSLLPVHQNRILTFLLNDDNVNLDHVKALLTAISSQPSSINEAEDKKKQQKEELSSKQAVPIQVQHFAQLLILFVDDLRALQPFILTLHYHENCFPTLASSKDCSQNSNPASTIESVKEEQTKQTTTGWQLYVEDKVRAGLDATQSLEQQIQGIQFVAQVVYILGKRLSQMQRSNQNESDISQLATLYFYLLGHLLKVNPYLYSSNPLIPAIPSTTDHQTCSNAAPFKSDAKQKLLRKEMKKDVVCAFNQFAQFNHFKMRFIFAKIFNSKNQSVISSYFPIFLVRWLEVGACAHINAVQEMQKLAVSIKADEKVMGNSDFTSETVRLVGTAGIFLSLFLGPNRSYFIRDRDQVRTFILELGKKLSTSPSTSNLTLNQEANALIMYLDRISFDKNMLNKERAINAVNPNHHPNTLPRRIRGMSQPELGENKNSPPTTHPKTI